MSVKYRTNFDNEKKIWSGSRFSPIFNRNVSVGEAVFYSLLKNPEKLAQISENNGIQFTQEEIRLKTIRAAQNITKLGLQKGDIIGIVANNHHHLAPIVFAAMSIGCPINALHHTFGKSDIVHMFGITKPKVIFCDQGNVELVRESINEIGISSPLYTFDKATTHSQSVDDLLVPTNMEMKFIPVQLDDGASHTAAIVCSSGTTGRSKGICLSHAMLLRLVVFQSKMPEVILAFNSLYWISGLVILIMGTIAGATRLITTNPFSPELCFRMIEKYKVNGMMTAPHHVGLMLRHESINKADMSSISSIVCGGSVVSEDLCKQMRKFLPNGDIYVAYGISETGSTATMNIPPKPGSVGVLNYGMEMKIIDEDGNHCGINESGEICMKVIYDFGGYYGDEEMTRNALDADGWFLTGDIGYFDDDGYLFYVERKKDILKYCNYPIPPSEIENVLMEHPAIAEVCVVGVPDPVCTDLPAAVIVIRDNAQLTVQEVHQFIADKLPDFKQLRGGVYFVDSHPITPSGKYLKRVIKDIVVQMYTNQKK